MQRHRWPTLLRRAHTAAFALLPLLLVTGALIYFPATHTALIPVLGAMLWIHAVAGIAFLVLLFLPVLAALPQRRFAWPDWLISLGVGAACSVTGILIWRIGWFPVQWRANAFLLHGATAIALAAWAAVHTARHIARAKVRRDPLPIELRSGVGRRDFLRAAGGGVLLAVFASISLDTIVRVLANAGSGAASLSTSGWQIYSVVSPMPDIPPADFRLRVDGLVGSPRTFTLAELRAMPSTIGVYTWQCVTGWLVPNVQWEGIDLNTLLNACGGARGNYLTFHSADGVYIDSLSLSQATDGTTMLGYTMNEAPLPRKHGGPLRLVVPTMYGYKSVKWVTRIEVAHTQAIGYWEQRGYAVNAYLPAGAQPGAGDVRA